MGSKMRGHSLKMVRIVANSMEPDKLFDEYEQIEDPEVEEVVMDVILDRRVCPRCGNSLMSDAKADILYCPIDSYEFHGS